MTDPYPTNQELNLNSPKMHQYVSRNLKFKPHQSYLTRINFVNIYFTVHFPLFPSHMRSGQSKIFVNFNPLLT